MHRWCALLLVVGCSETPRPTSPCADDAHCETGSYCAAGSCALIPAGSAVVPEKTQVAVESGSTVKLRAASAGGVVWSVQESGGGTIDAYGTYHPPSVAGTFHAIAANRNDPSQKGTVELDVVLPTATPVISA